MKKWKNKKWEKILCKKNWYLQNSEKMVFESIVADILNRYLGDYVENLDRGQLKIGIWGGK